MSCVMSDSLLNGGKVYCDHLLPGSILLAGGGASMGYRSDLRIILCTSTESAYKRENNQIVTTHTHTNGMGNFLSVFQSASPNMHK